MDKIIKFLEDEIVYFNELNDVNYHVFEINLSHAILYLNNYKIHLSGEALIEYVYSLVYLENKNIQCEMNNFKDKLTKVVIDNNY